MKSYICSNPFIYFTLWSNQHRMCRWSHVYINELASYAPVDRVRAIIVFHVPPQITVN